MNRTLGLSLTSRIQVLFISFNNISVFSPILSLFLPLLNPNYFLNSLEIYFGHLFTWTIRLVEICTILWEDSKTFIQCRPIKEMSIRQALWHHLGKKLFRSCKTLCLVVFMVGIKCQNFHTAISTNVLGVGQYSIYYLVLTLDLRGCLIGKF